MAILLMDPEKDPRVPEVHFELEILPFRQERRRLLQSPEPLPPAEPLACWWGDEVEREPAQRSDAE